MAHPLIGSGQESFLFSEYLVPQLRAYRWGAEQGERSGLGLCCYLTEDAFLHELRQYAGVLLNRMVAEVTSGADRPNVFVEKSPANALIMPEIKEIWPQTRFVMCVRNPASIAHSWVRSARTWAPWMNRVSYKELRKLVEIYLSFIAESARTFDEGTIKIVRYERFVDDPRTSLGELWNFAGVPFDQGDLDSAIEMNRFDLFRQHHTDIPLGGLARTRYASVVEEPLGFVRTDHVERGSFSTRSAWSWGLRRWERRVMRANNPLFDSNQPD